MTDKLIDWEKIELLGEEDNEHEDDDDDNYYSHEDKELKIKFKKLVQTPVGIFMSDDKFHPLRGLPTYVAHLNFPVIKGFIDKLDKIQGIEIWKILGRYRLLFVFGKMFNTDEVMDDIEKTLDISEDMEELPDDVKDELPEKAKEIYHDLQRHIESDYWLAYVFPNGKYRLLNIENEEEFIKETDRFKKLQEMSGGFLFSSADTEQNDRLRQND